MRSLSIVVVFGLISKLPTCAKMIDAEPRCAPSLVGDSVGSDQNHQRTCTRTWGTVAIAEGWWDK